ncbi:hypothetical protein I7V34_19150 [Bacillus sp. V3]|nr:hypothetical protein I7V34_19150 [Bacillus sp. V3]
MPLSLGFRKLIKRLFNFFDQNVDFIGLELNNCLNRLSLLLQSLRMLIKRLFKSGFIYRCPISVEDFAFLGRMAALLSCACSEKEQA